MKNIFFQIIFIAFAIPLAGSQSAEFCPIQKEYLRFDNIENLPEVTYNSDGTVNLTFAQGAINTILSEHVVYDFYQTYPNSTTELGKYYTLEYQNKDLINDLYENVSTSFFEIQSEYPFNKINSDLIDFLDGRKMEFLRYYENELGDECPECPLESVSEDFNLVINFDYNEITDILEISTEGITPCGNSFSIGLKATELDDTHLQLWSSLPPETLSSESCEEIEGLLYNIFGISCTEAVESIWTTVNEDNGTLRLSRLSGTFGRYIAEFEDYTLVNTRQGLLEISIHYNQKLENLKVNSHQKHISLTVFSLTGQKILQRKFDETGVFSLKFLPSGMYLVDVSARSGSNKRMKILKK